MAEVDYSDLGEAQAWFEEQTPEKRCLMSSRAALRVMATIGMFEGAAKERLALTTLRAALTSAGRGFGRAADVEELMRAARSAGRAGDNSSSSAAHFAANAATFSARSSANAASSAAVSASSAANSDLSARAAAYSALSAANAAGSAALSTHSAAHSVANAAHHSARSAALSTEAADADLSEVHLLECAVWIGVDIPSALVAAHEVWLALLDSHADWTFWHRWYSEMWNGTFRDWDLAIEVAKLPDEIWTGEDAVAKVAEAIRGIEARLLASRFKQAETISKDTADGRYTVDTVFVDPEDLIAKALSGLDFPLQLALRGHNQSGFSDLCVAFSYLDHTRQACADDPNAIHTHFKIARELIEDRLEEGSYRPEDGLVSLVKYLERFEVQLRADHPLIRETHNRLVQQRLREMQDEKRLQLAADFRELTHESKGRLSTEFELDATVIEQGYSEEASADALKRSGGRSQIMALAEKGSDAAKTIDASGGWKATKIGMTLVRIGTSIAGLM